MNFEQLMQMVGDEPVFESSLFLAGEVNPAAVRLQLNRWTRAGRLYKLRRGLYALAPPYQKTKPHPFSVANALKGASYVSCQSALAYYGLIPEYVPITVSVTTGRPCRWETPFGIFEFRHVKQSLFRGYRATDLGGMQRAFLATPEKALLDLIHLEPGSSSLEYLQELRLQNLEQLRPDVLSSLAKEIGGTKMKIAVERIVKMGQTQAQEYESL